MSRIFTLAMIVCVGLAGCGDTAGSGAAAGDSGGDGTPLDAGDAGAQADVPTSDTRDIGDTPDTGDTPDLRTDLPDTPDDVSDVDDAPDTTDVVEDTAEDTEPDLPPRGTAGPCDRCNEVVDCIEGATCVRIPGGDRRCMQLRSDSEGGACAENRVYYTPQTLQSTDFEQVSVCFPSDSCEAVRNYGRDCHDRGVTCLEREGGFGVCWAMQAEFVCTLSCRADRDCPGEATCIEVEETMICDVP